MCNPFIRFIHPLLWWKQLKTKIIISKELSINFNIFRVQIILIST